MQRALQLSMMDSVQPAPAPVPVLTIPTELNENKDEKVPQPITSNQVRIYLFVKCFYNFYLFLYSTEQ
jgi:hypothetical protein